MIGKETIAKIKRMRRIFEKEDFKINKSKLAKGLGISRKTLSKYLQEDISPQRRTSSVEQYKKVIEELLESRNQVFSYIIVLYRYLKEEYRIQISESAFYRYINSVPKFRKYFTKKGCCKAEVIPTVNYETSPGEQIQIDWKENILFVPKDTEETLSLNIFVILFGYSRQRFYFLSLIRNQKVVLDILAGLFVRIGGVPKVVLVDNNDAFMSVPRTKSYKGEINEQFQRFADDFGLIVCPCIAGTPQTKGKIEAQMKPLNELKAYSTKYTINQIKKKLSDIEKKGNTLINKGTGKIPIKEFTFERKKLNNVPGDEVLNRYRIQSDIVKVNSLGMIQVNSCKYSVPNEYIGKHVQYILQDGKLDIYSDNEIITTHILTGKKINYIEEHYRNNLERKGLKDAEKMTKRNLKIFEDRRE